MFIGKKWKVESDSLNIILSKKHVSKKGIERWETIGYYALIEDAFREFANHGLRETGLAELKQVLKKQQEIYDLIASLDKARFPIPKAVRAL